MHTVPGYDIQSQISESSHSCIYRARRMTDQQAVVLKILKHEYPTPEQVNRYRKEFQIVQAIQSDGEIQAYELLKHERGLVMVLEDIGASSLRHVLNERRLTLEEIIAIAERVATTLGEIHAAHVIHKDLNPSNILYNPDTGQVKLIDFGIAAQVSREMPSLENPNVLEGTLAYISPEQTGRMNRLLDYRTDYYSLGVTLYEMLTGVLPFEYDEPLELVHAHIACVPTPPIDIAGKDGAHAGEPLRMLSAIIMKLMSKMAEERYQSALGLIRDLEYAREQIGNRLPAASVRFLPGQHDVSELFQIPQKLYGRKQETAQLMQMFANTAAGGKEIVLCAGAPGIGKSALINEVHRPIVEKRGYFLVGKFDQFQRNIPYSAMIQAFRGLIHQLLGESRQTLDVWKTRILAAVGNNGGVIVDVIPEIEIIIGPQSEVAELGAAEAQNRFNLVFQSFIRVFAAREHPLVLFLDDLQWADNASLRLLQALLTDIDLQAFLFVGAYRDNEVDAAHPLYSSFLKGLQEQGGTCTEIPVTPLTSGHIGALAAETLYRDPSECAGLAALIHRKTGGNPFFVNEFFKALYEKGLIRFHQGWIWDAALIDKAEITENVVELMAQKIERLTPQALDILKTASCLGIRVELAALSVVCERSEEELFTVLSDAVNEGLLLKTGDTMQFAHDRVREAAYTLLNDNERSALHAEIGRHLLANVESETLEDRLFEITAQLNQAQPLLKTEERRRLLELNLQAGRKARASNAYTTAAELLRQAIGLLPENAWDTEYALALELHTLWLEARQLSRAEDDLEETFGTVLNRIDAVVDQVPIQDIRMSYRISRMRFQGALDIAFSVLEELGEPPARDAGPDSIQAEIEAIYSALGDRPIEDLLRHHEMTDPVKQAAMRIMSRALAPAIMVKPHLMYVIFSRMTWTFITCGNMSLSPYIYTAYSVLLASTGAFRDACRFANLGLKLAQQQYAGSPKGKVYWVYACTAHYQLSLREKLQYFYQSKEFCREEGDIEFLSYGCLHVSENEILSGKPLPDLEQICDVQIKDAQKTGFLNSIATCRILRQALQAFRGTPEQVLSWDGPFFADAELAQLQENNDFVSLGYCTMFKAFLTYLHGKPAEYVAMFPQLTAFLPAMPLNPITNLCFFLQALSLAALYDDVDAETQAQYREEFAGIQARLQQWRDAAPMNFEHRYQLVCAEAARIEERDMEAMRLYDRAIAGAKEQEFLHEEGIANECAARFYINRCLNKNAATYLQDAHYCYQRWGASAKVQQLEARYPQWLGNVETERNAPLNTVTTTISSTMTADSGASASMLDVSTVMKASQALSQEVELAGVLERFIRLVQENAGATHGVLLEPQANAFLVQAEGQAGKEIYTRQETLIEDASQRVLPFSILQYVAHIRKPVLLNDVETDRSYSNDPYFTHQHPRSLLCLPILHQNRLTAVLYLENHLSAGAFTPDRLELLNVLSSQAAISLKNARYVENLADQERLKQEMELAQRIQTALLPKKMAHPEFDIEAAMLPADEVGGDYYDVLTDKEGHLWLAIGDVSGHGVTPGMIMMMAQTLHSGFITHWSLEPKDVVNRLNRSLFDNVAGRLEASHFMTFTTLKYRGDGCFDFAGAHLDMIVHRAAGNTCELIDTPGCYLNFIPDIEHATEQSSLTLERGDTLVLYTDGLTEAQGADGEILDIQRFLEIVQRHAPKALAAMRDGILDEVLTWSEQRRDDDMTLLVVRRGGEERMRKTCVTQDHS